MKFAIVNGERSQAQPQLAGDCPGCGQPVTARCGDQRAPHWAHKRRGRCDAEWENETEWHRAWKNCFPDDWQEIVHRTPEGLRHIADVKTHDGWVLEFQHSHIDPDERRSREDFYRTLVWVVDGTRRLRDLDTFIRAWERGVSRDPTSSKRRIVFPDGALLRDWSGSPSHVIFDFGAQQPLCWLFPDSNEDRAYVQVISRQQFIRVHRETRGHGQSEFGSLVQNFAAFLAQYEPPPIAHSPPPMTSNLYVYRAPPIRRKFRL